MRAQEVERERVVTLWHGTGFGLGRNPFLPRGACRIAAHLVDERMPGNGDEPRPQITRPLEVRSLESAHQRRLHGILGRREICAASDEDADHVGDGAAERRRIHPRHPASAGGALITSRSSSHSPSGVPPAQGAADSSDASSSARS